MDVGPCGGVNLTCHVPTSPLILPSRTAHYCLCSVVLVAVNVAVQPSSRGCSVYISAPDWRWGEMWDILDLVDSKGLRLSSSVWFD